MPDDMRSATVSEAAGAAAAPPASVLPSSVLHPEARVVGDDPDAGCWRAGLPASFRAPAPGEEPPSWPLFATELGRAVGGVGLGALTRSVLRAAPAGDGHPVLVLPGIGGGDGTTRILRRVLRHRGYRAHGWHLGRNLGPTASVVAGVPARVGELAERYGQRVSVVGWSLGGLYARDAARRLPDQVRSVITLGSPIRLTHPVQTRAMALYQGLAARHLPSHQLPPPEALQPPLPMPSTSILSTWDGIVSWRACIEPPGPHAETIAVVGSHLELAGHPAVLWAITDRLARPEGEWRPFCPPSALRWLYPTLDLDLDLDLDRDRDVDRPAARDIEPPLPQAG